MQPLKLVLSLCLLFSLKFTTFAADSSIFNEDTLYVGNNQTLTSLTKAGGLFQGLNSGSIVLSANTTVLISSDLLEDGANPLTNNNLNGFTLTIKSSAAAIRHISNQTDLSTNLISITAARNIIFDGSVNGQGRYLRFLNTHMVQNMCKPVISIKSGSQNIVVKNAIIESNIRIYYDGTSNITFHGIVYIGDSNNKDIEISHCVIRNSTSGNLGIPEVGVISSGAGNDVRVLNNEILNFSGYGVRYHRADGKAVISGNHLYFNASQPGFEIQKGISVEQSKKYTISGNFIGGGAPYCAGSPWINNGSTIDSTNSTAEFTGIFTETMPDSGLIENNTIQNILLTGRHSKFTAIATHGHVSILSNMIGDTINANSIVNLGQQKGIFGIFAQTGRIKVDHNIIANLSAYGSPVDNGIEGIGIFNSYAGSSVKNNLVFALRTNSYPMFSFSGGQTITGINLGYLGHALAGTSCENNTVHSLFATSNAPHIKVYGIFVAAYEPMRVGNNKVFNLQNLSSSGFIHGIHYQTPQLFVNNQVSLTNAGNTNSISVRGIFGDVTFDSSRYYYNAVYIGGQTSGTAYSTTMWLSGNNNKCILRNNILYNERIGGSNLHYALSGIKFPQYSWPSAASNYNLFVSADTTKMMEWGTCCSSTAISMRQWRMNSLGDSSSYGTASTVLPATRFFRNHAIGDLNINTLDSICWYVNGKGIPVFFISGDYDNTAGVRSTSSVNGATDIGSDEFDTNTNPPSVYIYGLHQPGGADTLSVGQRIVAIIQWGNTGTLPALQSARWFSGEWPRDTTNNGTSTDARFLSGYLRIEAAGGSNYTYNLILPYDSASLGRITNAASMIINKRETYLSGSWRAISNSTVNTTNRTITANGLQHFSEFTATDIAAALETSTVITCSGNSSIIHSNISGSSYQWQVDTGTGYTNISNNANYSGSQGPSLTISSIPSAWYGYKYRCEVNGNYSIVKRIVFQNKWTGTVNNQWEHAGNWSCGTVPDSNSEVVIESGTIEASSSIQIRSLQLNNGVSLTVNAAGYINIVP